MPNISEYKTKTLNYIEEPQNKKLGISFIKIIDNLECGIPHTRHDIFSDKTKLSKILRTIIGIKEKTLQELIETPKASEGGSEKLNIDKLSWKDISVKNYLEKCGRDNKYFILRAGESRIIGYIQNNLFYIVCIEYNLNSIYKH
ncbi:hypothetical protein CFT13S00388_02445 [Campylobacter fetus subsp. testudinum]|uniref:hypothetical protein n=1 Tax=Campylobacter fetus TaxID=196 RepID=UPI0008187694|nr:hypothetical protein [Campylobacter fetus]OCR88047.1 hypothetical protein CFT13S00388_02445 [Campylobacter fetus subsp. testudinum]